jgi:hypothetical protein
MPLISLDLLPLCQFPRLMKYLDLKSKNIWIFWNFVLTCTMLTPNCKILLFFVQCKSGFRWVKSF